LIGTSLAAVKGLPVPAPDEIYAATIAAINAVLVPEMLAGHRVLSAFSRHPGAFHAGLATPKGRRTFAKFCRGEASWADVLRRRSARLALGLLSLV